MDTYARSKAYHCTIDTLQETLDEFGVAVVTGVLDSSASKELADDLWSYLEHITQRWDVPIQRANPSTWSRIYDLMPSHSMLMQHFEIGHSPAAWKVRQNPTIVDIFAKLHGARADDLLASFDGAAIGLPPEITRRGWQRPGALWMHTDQSFLRNDKECYQSWVTAHDVGVGDATLVVLERSHRLHGEFAETFHPDGTAPKEDWYKLNDEELAFYRYAACSEVRVACPAGSLVIWDSRTIHQGGQPLKGRPTARERAVVYLCYQPVTALAADDRAKAIQKKRRAFLDKRMTSHWPLKSKLFGKSPQHYGKGLPEITPIAKAIGLKWEKMPNTTRLPDGKIRLENDELSKILASTLELTPEEWKRVGVKGLTHDHVVKVGEDYLKPVDETLQLTPLGRTLAGFPF